MRLTCPNCGAQYEVADDVIPLSGRDVQCSACGNTWFQRPGEDPETREPEPVAEPRHAPDPTWDDPDDTDDTGWDSPAEETPVAEPSEPEPTPEPEPEPHPEPEAEAYAEAESVSGQAPEPDSDAPATSRRREIDPDLAEMLREEAELSRSARQAEQIETQPDLGLDEHLSAEEQRAREAQARMARLRGEDETPVAPAPDPENAGRRELLPDIDEINDTLRGETAAAGAAAAATVAGADATRRGGFRRGFILVLVIAILAAVLYLLAPMLAERFPTLAPPLTAYVEWVDGIRLWLDLKLQGLMGSAATDAAN